MKTFEDNSTGEQIKIMNIHLDRRSKRSREKTIELVLRKLIAETDPMPILVVGDFNVRPTNPVIQRKEEFFVGTFEGDILAACTYHDYYDGSHCPRHDYIFYLEGHGIVKTGYKINKWEATGL